MLLFSVLTSVFIIRGCMKFNDHFSLSFFLSYDQIRKETRKTVVPKVIVATPKVKEQDLVSRSREGITTKREQIQITQEKVNTDI